MNDPSIDNFDRFDESLLDTRRPRLRRMTADVHTQLRERIISGAISPNTVLSQAEVAREFGLSRGPIREAFSRLQAEGLITAEPNRQPRVAGFDAASLDSLYGIRIEIEALGARLTAGAVNYYLLAELHDLLDQMAASEDGTPEFRRAHRAFHRTVVSGGGPVLQDLTVSLSARSEPYFRLYAGNRRAADDDHAAVVAAFEARDVEVATRRHGQHVARTALAVLANMAPDFEPKVIRSALQTFQLPEPETRY